MTTELNKPFNFEEYYFFIFLATTFPNLYLFLILIPFYEPFKNVIFFFILPITLILKKNFLLRDIINVHQCFKLVLFFKFSFQKSVRKQNNWSVCHILAASIEHI